MNCLVENHHAALCLTRPPPLTIFTLNDNLFTLNVELHKCNEADMKLSQICCIHSFIDAVAARLHDTMHLLVLTPPPSSTKDATTISRVTFQPPLFLLKCLHPLHKYTLQTRFCRQHCQTQCTEVAEFLFNQLFEV